jgi:hypothetical protein
MRHPSFLVYAQVLEMAAVLDCADTPILARICPKREFGNGRHFVGGAAVGPPRREAVLDYFRLGGLWCCADSPDSVRDA